LRPRNLFVVVMLLSAASVSAQPRPLAGTTLVTTDTSVTSACIGANTINAPATCLGGLQAGPTVVNQAITLPSFTPVSTTNKLYNVGGNIFWNGLALATGGSVGPGTAGAIPIFTGAASIGNSVITGAGTVITIAGTVVSNLFGASSFTAGGVGDQSLTVRNTTAGVANRGVVFVGNDASAFLGKFAGNSSTFTTSGADIANGVKLEGQGVGGLSLSANNAAGIIHFFTGTGTTERGQITAAGLFTWTTFGAHTFAAAGTGANSVTVGNSTAGAGNYGRFLVTSDTVTSVMDAYSSSFTTAGAQVQAGTLFSGNGTGGVSLAAFHASGAVRIYSGGGTLRVTIDSRGDQTNTGAITAASTITAGGAAIGAPNSFDSLAADYGAAQNHSIHIGRNSNATPVAASVNLENNAGATNFLWVDATGLVRVRTGGAPGGPAGGDTGGTIVGTQSSTRDVKTLRGETLIPSAALATILQTPVHEFTYRNGAFNGTVFQGIVADEAPFVMMDRGQSFSPISAFGYTVQAIKALQAEIDALKAAR
jgi:hypothetical protein